MSEYICVACQLPITNGVMMGMGDGTGQKFSHRSCYWRKEAERTEAERAALAGQVAALTAQVARAEGALSVTTTALENIRQNVKGLTEGMVPNIGADAVWYFKMIRGVSEAALTAAAAPPDAAPRGED